METHELQRSLEGIVNMIHIPQRSQSTSVERPPHIDLPPSLHRWAAPEVIKRRACTAQADIYSLCALIQEVYTDCEPWGTVDQHGIKQAMDAGEALVVDSSIPQPYYDVVLRGLQHHPQDRTCSLQGLCYTLQQDIKVGLTLHGHIYVHTFSSYYFQNAHGRILRSLSGPVCALQRFSLEEQMTGGLCEQDRGPEVQATAQHRPIVGEPVQSVVHRTVRLVTGQAERHVHLDKHLYRGAKPQPGRERTEGESTFRQVYPYAGMLPLLGEFDSVSSEEEPEEEPEAHIDREFVEQLDDLNIATDQQMSTIAVNLKVSRELLRQSSRSLDKVEKHLQLDHSASSRASSVSSFSTSSTNRSGVSAAVGPPSKHYSLFPHRGDAWGKKLEAQLLSRDWELLSQEELALWLSYYPAEQQQREGGRLRTGSRPVGADPDEEEPSLYRSALDSSLLHTLSEKQQTSSSSPENADVTMEVCRPAASGSQLLDTHNNTKYESFPDSDPDASGTQAQSTANPLMEQLDSALLAELSSITDSPAQPEKNLHGIRGNGRAPSCYSTPRSPGVRRHVMPAMREAGLPDFPVCMAESFTTPPGKPPPFKAESASSPEGFITASQEEELVDPIFPSFTAHRGCSTEEEEGPEQSEERQNGGSQSPARVYDEEEEEGAQEKLMEMQRESQLQGKTGGENMVMEEEKGGEHVEEEEQHGSECSGENQQTIKNMNISKYIYGFLINNIMLLVFFFFLNSRHCKWIIFNF
ncbi:uncharacterized protein LOC130211680 isoform X3 [Pseudoliparis swirei]|uniref:uncharacterized protein LOC130211680 isoform X3 n=1 Tax=Pseudoliparis swirei TaxID=2059687 RepID=UPI0024BEFFE2|nr:uncharacterized protein LOC130211680 isoform X3 [Pseudoliparis swirei]